MTETIGGGDENAERLVYLVQHGQAKSKDEDPERPLTDAGRRSVEQVATRAAAVGVSVGQIRHSGKLRARQTAEILAEKLQPREGVTSYPGLGPNDDVEPLLEALADCPCTVIIVGHLPQLSRLAALLLSGHTEPAPISFSNGGLVGLKRDGQRWTLCCLVPPEWA